MLKIDLNLDTLSVGSGWLYGNSLNIGWGGLSATGEGVFEVDLFFLFLLSSSGLRSSGNSELFARSIDSVFVRRYNISFSYFRRGGRDRSATMKQQGN